jgi:hypothetical protein
MQWKERAVVKIARLLRIVISGGKYTTRFCVLLITAAGAIALVLWIRGMGCRRGVLLPSATEASGISSSAVSGRPQ